ncbi:MAG TPA: UDP-N-acetylmuramoyl-tripeptide--D-alanyl-D-alanine ligase [Solirubrobacteraceae bacterium]|nr:UDP-N-acetylmuramoyl-tripeptide--D-alanyl-D-alanine ligase [Solirubrobacteraceae bacterium]
MKGRDTAWVVEAIGGELLAGDPAAPGPRRAIVDTRVARAGDLFFGLPGERSDGGLLAPDAFAAGAWGVVVAPEHGERAVAAAPPGAVAIAAARGGADGGPGARSGPLAALQALARAWRRELACRVVGVTGSTGKTSTKDILAALLEPHRVTHANSENLNTEIGLPLTILEAAHGTEVLVLEMAMRGEGQIAELAAIAEPDVGVIVNVGPVHLELLGTVERVAAAKAELIRDLRADGACVVPAAEPLLERHLRDDLDTTTFGPGGEVMLLSFAAHGDRPGGIAEIEARGERVLLDLPYSEPYNLLNTLAAVGAAQALGVRPNGVVQAAFSSLRGEIVELAGGVTVVNDCYNANPMSMRAALKHLAETPAQRRVAVLGAMAELGGASHVFHREIGEEASALGIDVLITVGRQALDYSYGYDGESYSAPTPEEAGALLAEIALPGDRVLVKGSRSAGLERVLA